MELRLNIGYEQVLNLVKQLSYNDRKKLTTEIKKGLSFQKIALPLDKKIKSGKPKTLDNELIEFQNFLLQGPIMTDEQFGNYKKLRKSFNQWIDK